MKDILLSCRRLYDKGFLASADGNISFRRSENEIIITPSGVSKAFIKEEDLAVINLKGETLKGKPSSESLMHLEIYRKCPKAKAVVHAHPPYSIAFSLSYSDLKELPTESLPEVILAVGKIPLIEYAKPGTKEMAEKIAPFLPELRVFILSRHGGLCWGEDLDEASRAMERLEHSSQILFYSYLLKKPQPLDKENLKWLYEKRKEIGPKTL